MNYIEEQTFDKKDFTKELIKKGDYEECIFNNCNLYNVNLSGFKFINCEFHDCDLSLIEVNQASFQNTKFKNCKLLGVKFDKCSSFGFSVSFDGCQLNHASFYATEIKNTLFKDTQLQGVDFTESNLTAAIFDNCNFAQANFNNTILEKADFRTSYNYSINPDRNRIQKAKFSMLEVVGLLDSYGIEIS